MKKTPLKRKTPMKRGGAIKKKSALKKTKLRKQSKEVKKVRERKLYTKLRKIYLANRTTCECGTAEKPCSQRATDIHHKAGRATFLNRIDTWMAVSRECHNRIHKNPEESYKRGHLINAASLLSKERNQ